MLMSGFTNNEGSGIAVQEAAHLKPGNHAANWRQSKWLGLGELVVVALIFVADARHLIPFRNTPFLLLQGFEPFVSQPLLVRWLGKQPDLEVFRALTGNLKLTLIFLALTWTLAAFGEEMVYRGYLMNRVADLLNRTRRAWIVSLFAVHIGFGLAHAYQGLTGIIDEGLMGLLLGLIYLRTGRNLAVPIIAHGIGDSIDFVLIFFGKYPGM